MLFPAPAGVILKTIAKDVRASPFPRASGGDPFRAVLKPEFVSFSPRQRGCIAIELVYRFAKIIYGEK